MSTEIKNTLFSFVTMRGPELAEKKQKNFGFIERPTGMKGAFDNVTTPSGRTRIEAKQLAIVNETIPVTEFSTVLKTEQQIVNLNTKIFDFGIWIAKNKYNYTVLNLNKELAKLVGQTLTDIQISALWDSLFYQVLTQESFYVKESIIQMLVAANYLKNKTSVATDNDELLNAVVVLPKSLFLENNNSSVNNSRVAITPEKQIVRPTSESMLKLIAKTNAEASNAELSTLKQELAIVKKRYNKEYQLAYATELSNYNARVKPVLDQYKSDCIAEKNNWCKNRNTSIPFDEKNPCDAPEDVKYPEIEAFSFAFRKELEITNLENNLSSKSLAVLNSLLSTNTNSDTFRVTGSPTGGGAGLILDDLFDGFDDLDDGIAIATHNNNQTAVQNTTLTTTQTVYVNGTSFGINNASSLEDFEFEISPPLIVLDIGNNDFVGDLARGGGGRKQNIFFKLKLPDNTWKIASATITLSFPTEVFTVNIPTNFPIGAKYNFVNMLQKVTNGVIVTGLTQEMADNITKISGEFNFENYPQRVFSIDSFAFDNTTSYYGFLTEASENSNSSGGVGSTTVAGSFAPSGFGVKKIGIADYKKVEQSVQCYVEGEVAHIENIMARERREKATKRTIKTEDTQTQSSTSEKEKTTDTATTDRFEMQSEVAKVLQESKDFSAGASFNINLVKANFGGNVNFATHSSKEENTRQAITQAKEVTQKASERVSEKVFKERVTKVVEEFEETNIHEFDNRKGDKHIVGVYRWVDKVYKNQIYNYGKRLMFEFMVPEPAKLHHLGMQSLLASDSEKIMTTPIDPRKATENKLVDYTFLANETVLKFWTSYYNVAFEPLPLDIIYLGKSIAIEQAPAPHESVSKSDAIKIDERYIAIEGKATIAGSYDGANEQRHAISALFGDQTYSVLRESNANQSNTYSIDYVSNGLTGVSNSGSYQTIGSSTSGFKNEVPISLQYYNYHTGTVNFNVKCKLGADTIRKWQQKTFNAIVDKYEEALEAYNKKMQEAKDEVAAQKAINPGYYRQIENIILRKNCVSYLIDQDQNAKNTYGKNFSNNLDSFGGYEVNLNKNLDEYTALVKFVEEAFEWDIMSYNFYPFYWGKKSDWQQKFQIENDDALFRSFLQSGMARVIVTVRPSFENAVNWYMQTGQIWNGGSVPVIEDPLYMSIIDELKKPAGAKEGKAWLTRVPTSLTILQANSIGLVVDKALPCHCDEKDDFENPELIPCNDSFELNNNLINNNTGTAKLFGRIDGLAGLKTQVVLKVDENTIQDTTMTNERGQWELKNLPSGLFILNLDFTRVISNNGYTILNGDLVREVNLSNDNALEVNLTVKK